MPPKPRQVGYKSRVRSAHGLSLRKVAASRLIRHLHSLHAHYQFCLFEPICAVLGANSPTLIASCRADLPVETI